MGLKGSAGRIAPHSTLADLERCSRAHSDNGLEAASLCNSMPAPRQYRQDARTHAPFDLTHDT